MSHMQDKIGTNKYDRQGIADVFARGQSQPTAIHHDVFHDTETRHHPGPTIKRQNADTGGVNAEMIKQSTRTAPKNNCYDCTTNVIKPSEEPPPPNWRDTTIEVRTKCGDPVFAIRLPVPLFNPHLTQTLQPTPFPTCTTHNRHQPVR